MSNGNMANDKRYTVHGTRYMLLGEWQMFVPLACTACTPTAVQQVALRTGWQFVSFDNSIIASRFAFYWQQLNRWRCTSCDNNLGNFVSFHNSITAYRLVRVANVREIWLLLCVRLHILISISLRKQGSSYQIFKESRQKSKRKTKIAHLNTVENPRMPSVNCCLGEAEQISEKRCLKSDKVDMENTWEDTVS